MSKPLVSIIIPTYNRAHLIEDTLNSIAKQTYVNWECIVVDDGSSDASLELLEIYCRQDERFQYYKRPKSQSKGANACRNYGFEKSKGEFVIWFDSDDIMKPFKIEKQLNFLLENPDYHFCVDKYDNFSLDGTLKSEPAFDLNNNNSFTLENYVLHKNYWGTINLMTRRSACEVLRFDESLKSGQEYNFFIGYLANNPNAKGQFLNEALCQRRLHDNTIQSVQRQNKSLRLENKFNIYWSSYIAYNSKLKKHINLFLIKESTLFYHKLMLLRKEIIPIEILGNALKTQIGFFKTMLIYFVLKMNYTLQRGDVIGNKLINRYI